MKTWNTLEGFFSMLCPCPTLQEASAFHWEKVLLAFWRISLHSDAVAPHLVANSENAQEKSRLEPIDIVCAWVPGILIHHTTPNTLKVLKHITGLFYGHFLLLSLFLQVVKIVTSPCSPWHVLEFHSFRFIYILRYQIHFLKTQLCSSLDWFWLLGWDR